MNGKKKNGRTSVTRAACSRAGGGTSLKPDCMPWVWLNRRASKPPPSLPPVAGSPDETARRKQAYEDIAMLTRRYHAGDEETIARALRGFRAQDRISFRLRPTGITDHR